MAQTSRANASLNAAGTAKTSAKIAEVSLNALPLPQVMQPVGQAAPAKVSKAVNQRLIEEEELLQDKIVVEELPQALQANAMGDVLMAQASVPAAGTTGTTGTAGAAGGAAATTAAVAVPAAATATGFAGMTGLGLLGAAAGVVGVAAVASSGGSNPPPVAPVPLFSVTDVADVVKFSGTAAGDITVSIVGGVATFSRGGNQASDTVTDLHGKTVDLAAGQVLKMTLAQFKAAEGLKITGAGDVFVDGTALSGTSAVTESVLINVVLNSGNLTFDLPEDDNDVLVLTAGSVIDLKGGNLIVDDGQLNAKLVAAGAFNVQGNVILNSGLILTVAQLEQIDGQLITDGTGKLEIIVSTVAEANALAGLLESRAPTQAGASVPAVSFSIPADATAAASVNAALVVALDAINVAVKQSVTANSIVTVLSIETAFSLGAALPANYAINASIFSLGKTTVDFAAVDIATIKGILGNAKAPVPAIADIFTLSLSDTLSVLVDGANSDVLALANSITLTNTATTASDLNALDGKTSAPINAESVTTLSGTAAEIATALSSNGIATSDNANLTVSDAGGSVLTATALSDLVVKTTGTVTVTDAVVITGTTAEITAALVTDPTRVFANLATVTFTDIPTQDELAAIKGVHAGTIIFKTLTLIEAFDLVDSDAALPAAKTYNIDFGDLNGVLEFGTFTAEEIRISDQRFGSLKANAVNLINERDIKNAIFTIEDTAANLLAADIFQSIDGAREIIVIDEAGVILTASDLTLLASIQNTGPVTVTNAVVITGTTAQLLAALVTPETRVFADKATVTFIDTPNDNDRLAIENAISGADSLKTFTWRIQK